MNLLINSQDIREFKDISLHTTDARINEFIRDAQEQDLRPLLGNSFYFDILNNIDNEIYSELIEGSSFDKGNCTWTHQGLKMVLVEFFWGRYSYFGVHNDTPFGNTIKLSEFSKESESKDRRDIWEQCKQRANSYFDITRYYLNDSDFEMWNNGCDCSSISGRHLRCDCSSDKSEGFSYSLIR